MPRARSWPATFFDRATWQGSGGGLEQCSDARRPRAPGSRAATDLAAEGARVMTVCNACRYCEQYCPVFPAMERRTTFARTDLSYLANLCHNCGECLYACQYAPPHEFGINVPKTMSKLRVDSYESLAWPSFAAAAFRKPWRTTAIALAVGLLIPSPVYVAFF